ncbi:hypothetical protein PHYSODRAFT_450941, partial [Phytophthora sojae]
AQGAPMPPPARAHCRVFVVAARTHTRVLALQNAYEQDNINVYDQSPALASVLQDAAPADAQDEKKRAEDAYQTLWPALEQAAEWLKPRVDPALCYAHFVLAESELGANFRTQGGAKTAAAARVTRRLDQLRDRARSDGRFPFALNVPAPDADADSVTSSGDLRVVTPAWRRYFSVVGTNYFSGHVAPSLSPGQVEVFGVLHVDAGGRAGTTTSESDADAAEMVFDVRERWRRSKRQRQVNVALNTSDFYGREYPGFSRSQVRQAVVKLELKQQQADMADADTLQHPCYLAGQTTVVEGVNVTVGGSGDAVKCMTLLESHVASSNTNCPSQNFCFLGSAPQPQGFGSFYASGVLREAVISANRVLEYAGNKQEENNLAQLQLPTPTLPALQDAAKSICALPYKDVVAGAASSQLSATGSSALGSTMENERELCLDLCYTIVLLQRMGVQDDDERIHFVEHFEKQPVLSRHGSGANAGRSSPPELVAWLTGAFLYLEALQRKVTFSIESELLAEQLSAGLPLGWNMSLLVFVAAGVFLYFTTGVVAKRTGRGSTGYRRVINGGAKAKYKDTTQSIVFVDDARE